jgi:hypothetical protein
MLDKLEKAFETAMWDKAYAVSRRKEHIDQKRTGEKTLLFGNEVQ